MNFRRLAIMVINDMPGWVKYLFLLSVIFTQVVLPVSAQKKVSVADFGALPGDTINDRDAIQKAVNFCRIHKIKKLVIPAGVYRIREEKAVQLMNDIMNWKMGKNSQDVIYTPYYPYTRGIHFKDIRGLEVDAKGAIFFIEGWMEPVSIENSTGITIDGLTIDYKTPPHSEGVVTNVSDEYFDVKYSPGFPVKNNIPMPRIMFWDLAKNRLIGQTIYHPSKNELLDSNTVRIWAPHPDNLTGTIALINHTLHFRPAILLLETTGIVLNQVTIHSQPGMGIVGHRSTNILMKGLRIVPRPGLHQSTNTDATHFTSCKGTIRFEGCQFEGHGDDATNVHGYYQVVTRRLSSTTYGIQMEKAWGTHAMVLDFPDRGNTMELVEKKTLNVVDSFKVIKTDTFSRNWESVVQLNKPLPEDVENYYLIDVTRLPRLEFVSSYIGSHLARAVLVKTRNVLIENCVFREGTGTAIHIGAEGDWREGPGSQNVTIRNNRFIRCGRGDGANDGATAIAVNAKAQDVSATGVHKNILIEGNLVEGENAEYGIAVSGATGVMIRNNVFSNCKKPWNVKHSKDVKFQNNYTDQSGFQHSVTKTME